MRTISWIYRNHRLFPNQSFYLFYISNFLEHLEFEHFLRSTLIMADHETVLYNVTVCLGFEDQIDTNSSLELIETRLVEMVYEQNVTKLLHQCLNELFPLTFQTSANRSTIDGQNPLNSMDKPSNGRPWIPSNATQIAWSALFAMMVTIAIAGNLCVIFIVVSNRHMRTVTNLFILNLAFVDLIMATCNAIFNFVYMLTSDWPFGRFYCTFSNFIAYTTVACSVLTITVTALDK